MEYYMKPEVSIPVECARTILVFYCFLLLSSVISYFVESREPCLTKDGSRGFWGSYLKLQRVGSE